MKQKVLKLNLHIQLHLMKVMFLMVFASFQIEQLPVSGRIMMWMLRLLMEKRHFISQLGIHMRIYWSRRRNSLVVIPSSTVKGKTEGQSLSALQQQLPLKAVPAPQLWKRLQRLLKNQSQVYSWKCYIFIGFGNWGNATHHLMLDSSASS